MLPCGAARSQLSWGERLQSADGTGRAGRACSRCAGAGTRCFLAALFSASAAGESDCRARTTRGVLVSRDRIASAAALVAAVRSCPPPVRRGRATAERRRHVACSSHAISTRRRRHLMLPCGAALRQLGLGERLQSADCTWRAGLTASAAASDAAVLRCPPPAWLGRATAERGRHMACSSSAIGMSRALPAAALGAAVLPSRFPLRLGRSAAERGRHVECSSCAIATRRRPYSVLPGGAALTGERLQCADGT